MNLLSASELQKIFSTEGGVPQKGGQKDYAPDGSWLHQRKLEAFHEERADVLGQERVRTLGSLIKGEWLPEEGRVQLPKQGKFSKYMGYTENSKQYLLPEETMYLLDEASIQVYFQETPLSIQEALFTILMPFVPLEQYQVFSYFSRIGYILRRYKKPTFESYEERINLQKYSKPQKRVQGKRRNDSHDSNSSNYKKSKLASSISDKTSSIALLSKNLEETSALETEINEHVIVPSTSSSENVSEMSYSHHTSAYVESCDSEINQSSDEEESCKANDKYLHESAYDDHFCRTLPYSSWDYCKINFPDISRSELFNVSPNISSLLPPTVCLKTQTYDFSQYNKKGKRRRITELEFSCGSSGCKAKRQAINWADYKAQMAAVNEEEVLLTSPVGHLWEGDVQPLIKPQEAVSTDIILQKLSVIKTSTGTHCTDCIASGRNTLKEDYPEIVYDGYEPSSKFKKTNPGKPNFRLVIMRQDDTPPSLSAIYQICNQSVEVDGVPIYWAVVDSGDIAFYSINTVELPKHISMG